MEIQSLHNQNTVFSVHVPRSSYSADQMTGVEKKDPSSDAHKMDRHKALLELNVDRILSEIRKLEQGGKVFQNNSSESEESNLITASNALGEKFRLQNELDHLRLRKVLKEATDQVLQTINQKAHHLDQIL